MISESYLQTLLSRVARLTIEPLAGERGDGREVADVEWLPTLPEDYTRFIGRYGEVSFDNCFFVKSLANYSSWLDLWDAFRSRLDLIPGGIRVLDLGVYPDEPYLIPFGGDFDGGVLCWWFHSSYKRWPVVEVLSDHSEVHIHDMLFLEWMCAKCEEIKGHG